VIYVTYVFFHLKSYSFNWDNIDDPQGIKIGGTFEYNYGEAFQQAEKTGKIEVQRVATDEKNFEKLLIGRIQIFPNDLDVGYDMLRKIFTPEQVQLFTHHLKPVRAEPHRLLLSKKIKRNKRMMELFNKGLKRLKASGKVEQYLAESRRGEYKNK
jgi:polar amino acid transport system substrate-binding protein